MARYEELRGKRVMVTGAASGIGLATACRFACEGAKVFIVDYNKKALEATQKEHPEFAGFSAADVSDEENVKQAFAEMDRLLGGIDVLISNAGISIRSDALDIPYAQWKKVMDINLGGMFLCAKEAGRRMKAQGGGVILMTASSNGTEGHRWYADYNASQAGGYVLTPMQRAEYTDEMLAKVNEGIPMKRHATPEEIGALYAFLASDDAQYITGADIRIDGGETAGLYS